MRRENTSFLAPHTIHLLYTSLLSLSLHHFYRSRTHHTVGKETRASIFLQDGGLARLKISFSLFYFLMCMEKIEKLYYRKKKNHLKFSLFFCKRYTAHATGVRCKQDEISKETEWTECVRMKIFVHWKNFVSFWEREREIFYERNVGLARRC